MALLGPARALFVVWFLALASLSCIIHPIKKRKFADEASAARHFNTHRAAFQGLVEEWLASGRQRVCTFGADSIWLDAYEFRKGLAGWKVTFRIKGGWKDQSVSSLEEAARMARTTAHEILRWQEQMLAVEAQCLDVVPIRYRGVAAKYVQIAFSPLPAQGLRFAPAGDVGAREALDRWASIRPPRPGLAMRAFRDGWFYYEGIDTRPPFSAVSGSLRYANGQPAGDVNVRLERAFGWSNSSTRTDAHGSFHATWATPGRYRMVVEVFDTGLHTYRTYYYPGDGDPDRAVEIVLGEEESRDVGSWSIPFSPP